MELSNFVRNNIRNLIPYSSARDEAGRASEVYLDANENPFPNGINRYPDPQQYELKKCIAAQKGIDTSQLLLGNGSDEIIDLLIRSFCNPGIDEIIITPPTYGMYKVLADINNVICKEVRLSADFSLNVKRILETVSGYTKIIMLCSPNNPSGNLLAIPDITTILQEFKGPVLIDEAYIDFAKQDSWLTKLHQYPNLIVCQTLSKAWAMAGLRVGIAIASREIINVLQKIKPPYNINQLTQDRAIELLQDTEGYRERVQYLLDEKEKLITALNTINVIKEIFPSDANFLLVRFDDPDKVYQSLTREGIVVRNRSMQPLCTGCLRITIGLKEENEKLISALKRYTA